ncbi:MAG: carboxypeptidase regulatory-like domain-containing protein, partial [Acidobacteriaceae bacterium]|nr:carboxypeptidase regulatory-like domain-containing protein [Acidobacteriaceae bacterium]
MHGKCLPARTRARCFLYLGALAFLCAFARIEAQNVSTGSIQGQVTDPSGAAIPGAQVKLVDLATNTPHTETTNSDGRYTFVDVDPGTYRIEISKEGFALSKIEDQKVEVGLVLTLNMTLQVGSTTTTVEVQAVPGAELQTTTATVGTTITGSSIEMLPNLGRDANAFVTLQPAVTPTGEVAGLPMDASMFQLDGGNNTNDMDGSMNIYTPSSGYVGSSTTGGIPSGVIPTPAESIEEFKVSTNNQTADFNQAGGAQISMVTKRGTNTFHGSAYEFYLGSNFGANYWLNNHTPSANLPYTPLPSSHQNRFGGSLGGTLLPNFLGGKTYFFVNYEGRRFPQSTTIEKLVPSPALRAGLITLPNAAGVNTVYNINPYPVSFAGVLYPACTTANYCDPRHIGMNSIVNTIWSKFEPLPNDPTAGDGLNTQGYLSSIALPQHSDFGVIRIDHDFGQKWHLMSSYRDYKFTQTSQAQVDIGGLLCGHIGQACATSLRPQQPWFLVIGLTGTLTANTTNDLHVSYLRNFWQWSDDASPPQLAGLGGAVEMGGESFNALVPYNVNTQNTRQRFWDGKDKMIRDDVSTLHGNHLFQWGGSYQRNYNFHQRNDNGVGIDTSPVYQLGTTATGGS